jgi:hypothetical protein
MSYDNIRFVKLVTGDAVLATYDEENKVYQDIAAVQAIPAGNGMQIAILPFGFPYEEEIGGEISEDKVIYIYSKIPEELKEKYVEAKSNIKIASNLNDLGTNNASGGSGLII